MALTAQNSFTARLAAAASAGLLALTAAAVEPQPCDAGPTIREIRLATTRPLACISVKTANATLILDKAQAEVYATEQAQAYPDDERMSRLTALRARKLLEVAKPAEVKGGCLSVDQEHATGDLVFYVARQIDQGLVVVYPDGSSTPAASAEVRDSARRCGTGLGGISTRAYRFLGGRHFLAFITSVS